MKKSCKNCNHFEHCVRVYNLDSRCVDYEAKPLTNEQWFCGLSTEEKAEFLVKIEMSAMHPVKRGAVDMEKFIEEVAEWLKQPHTTIKE